jgi:hypothetical protein
MKRFIEIFSKKRGDNPQTLDKKEKIETTGNANDIAQESKATLEDLFGDDKDLGYC